MASKNYRRTAGPKTNGQRKAHSAPVMKSRSGDLAGDLLFLPVGAVLTLTERVPEIFNDLVAKGRKAEPRIRKNLEKVRERIDSLDIKTPEWIRESFESSSKKARELYDELNIEDTLKGLKVRERVEKFRARIQELVR